LNHLLHGDEAFLPRRHNESTPSEVSRKDRYGRFSLDRNSENKHEPIILGDSHQAMNVVSPYRD